MNNVWASDTLANNNHSYIVNIPKNIAPGDYVRRYLYDEYSHTNMFIDANSFFATRCKQP